jgi:flagella basal body P-ring formation protein FlgA
MRRAGTATPVLVKSGQAVNLLWEQGHLRLTRVMISLDSGRAGERIRTRARDGGPIVPGRVISAGWVRARE